MMEPKNDFDDLVAAFMLAMLAPDKPRCDAVLTIAEGIADGAEMSVRDIKSAMFIADLLTDPICNN